MKYLLTSAGIKNISIPNALVDLLGKPIAESSALCIPTAIYPCLSHPGPCLGNGRQGPEGQNCANPRAPLNGTFMQN